MLCKWHNSLQTKHLLHLSLVIVPLHLSHLKWILSTIWSVWLYIHIYIFIWPFQLILFLIQHYQYDHRIYISKLERFPNIYFLKLPSHLSFLTNFQIFSPTNSGYQLTPLLFQLAYPLFCYFYIYRWLCII